MRQPPDRNFQIFQGISVGNTDVALAAVPKRRARHDCNLFFLQKTRRIIEHKHFEFQTGEGTVITREYPTTWKKGDEPYYPINDEKNGALYAQYAELAKKEANVLFGGRLGQYKYYDMDKVIRSALDMVKEELAR